MQTLSRFGVSGVLTTLTHVAVFVPLVTLALSQWWVFKK
jgi:hypothetical protein